MHRTAIVRSKAELNAFAQVAQFPCLLKPIHVGYWKKFPTGHRLADRKVAPADEANARLAGSGDAAPYAGVGLCWLHYLDLIGLEVVPVSPVNGEFRHIRAAADPAMAFEYMRALAGSVLRAVQGL